VEYVTLEEALEISDEDDDWRRFQVSYPISAVGNFSLERFSIPRDDKGRAKILQREGLARDPGWGDFTRLIETLDKPGEEDDKKRLVWMSDTKAEISEHYPLFNEVMSISPKRILINGLGLGVAVHGALQFKDIQHVDVVEINPDVIELVGQYVTEDPRVTIHLADAYEIKWPKGTSWDLAWHDIWPTIDDGNVQDMKRIMSKYRNRAGWQDCWQMESCRKMADVIRRIQNGTMPLEEAMYYAVGGFPH
jgi:hypothetical protein